MVESVGSNGAKVGDPLLAPIARVASPAPVKVVTSEAPAAASTAALTAKALAAHPPVDAERVRRIKAAVESGAFPLSPATIADRLIAIKYQWMSNDEA